MVRAGFSRLALLLLLGFAAISAPGCGSNPFEPPPDDGGGGLPDNTPLNDSPANTMLRFEATYENQVIGEYEKLFTSDFRFTFSSQSDEDLVIRYGTSWGKDDEIESTRHLFQGFIDSEGKPQAAATQITLDLNGMSELPDPSHDLDSLEYFRLMAVPALHLILALADNSSGYEVQAPHDFFLIRGDLAGSLGQLDPGQEAGANRWYIYRWDDKSPELPAAPTTGPYTPASVAVSGPLARTSWGAAKVIYRN
jgi:hypothetical protein